MAALSTLRRSPLLLAAVMAGAAVAIALSRIVAGTGEPALNCDEPVAWDEAAELVGSDAAVVGPVAEVTFADEVGGSPTFVNLGNAHPDPDRFDVVVYPDVRQAVESDLETWEGHEACAVGTVGERAGVPQVVLDHPVQLERR